MKKTIVILLAAVLILLSGCGAGKTGTDVTETGGQPAAETADVNRFEIDRALVTYAANTLIAVTDAGRVLFDTTSEQTREQLAELETWRDVARVVAAGREIYGLRKDGGLYALHMKSDLDQYPEEQWSNVVDVKTFSYLDTKSGAITAALCADGGVVCRGLSTESSTGAQTGTYQYKGFKESEWVDIKAIDVTEGRLLGLKNDGTVIAAGACREGEADVDSWRDIEKIIASDGLSIGIAKDGTVYAAGRDVLVKKLSGRTNVDAIMGGHDFIFVKKDGTYESTYAPGERPAYDELAGMTDVKQRMPAGDYIAVLHSDGTVGIAGQSGVISSGRSVLQAQSWTNVVSLCGGSSFLAGVTADGRVLVTEGELNDQPFKFNTDDWDLLSPGAETGAGFTTGDAASQTTAQPAADAGSGDTVTVEGHTFHFGKYVGDDGVSVCWLNGDGTFRFELPDGAGYGGTWKVVPGDIDGGGLEFTDDGGDSLLYWPCGDDAFATAFRAEIVYRYAANTQDQQPDGGPDGDTFTAGSYTMHYGRYQGDDGVATYTLRADGTYSVEYSGAGSDSGTWELKTDDSGDQVLVFNGEESTTFGYFMVTADDTFVYSYRMSTTYTYVGA